MVKVIFRFFTLISIALIVSSCSQENVFSPTETVGPVAQPQAAGITLQGEVTQVNRSDGTPLVFARGSDNKLYYSDCKVNAVSWYPFWTQICGSATISGNIVAVAKSNGEVWLFSKNSSNKVVYSKYPTNGTFSNWATLGGTTGLTTTATADIVAGLNTNGTIEVCAKKTSVNTLFKLKQNTSGTWPTSWPTSAMASGTIGDRITVAVNYTGRLQVFTKNSSNQLVTLYQTTAGGSWTTSYSNLSGTVSRNISVVANHTNALEVYVINNQSLQRRVQTGVSTWASWEIVPVSPVMSTVTVIKPNYTGKLEAYFVGSNGYATRAWQNTAGSWVGAGVQTFGAKIGPLTMPQNANIPSISVGYHPSKQNWMFFAYGSSASGTDLHFTYLDYNDATQWVIALCPFDKDGNGYKVVKIGTQIWMAENFKATTLKSGSAIPVVTDNAEWAAHEWYACCWNNNDIANKNTYGALYNFYAAENAEFGIEGWHVPTESEWVTLSNYLGGDAVSGGKLKETGLVHWLSPNDGATNETGFTALPGGCRNKSGDFVTIGTASEWWSSTKVNPDDFYSNGVSCYITSFYRAFFLTEGNRRCGLSIRLVRDN